MHWGTPKSFRPWVFAIISMICVHAGICKPALAEGILNRWANEGDWVRWNWSLKKEAVGADQSITIHGKMMLKFLGREQIEGRNHRRIEMVFTGNDFDGKQHELVHQVLVQEEWKDEEKMSLHRPAEMLFQVDGGEVTTRPPRERPRWLSQIDEPLDVALDEIGAALEAPQPIEVEYQQGKLTDCEGKCGKKEVQSSRPDPNGEIRRWERITSAWSHDKLPFGFTKLESVEKEFHGDRHDETETVELFLQDFGTGAKAQMKR